MKVLVTGGAGFIASHIVDKLTELNHEVSVVDNLSTGKREYVNNKAAFYKCDITDIDKLNIVFEVERPDVVIHHAAQIDVQTSLKEPNFDAEVNIVGTVNILECCRQYGVKKIIYASSAAAYGEPKYLPIDEKHSVNPISFYGISKHTPEHYIKAYSKLCDLRYTILRYANVYGIRQDPKGEGGVVSIFINKLIKNEQPVIFGDGEQTRDFVYVKDIARANALALDKGNNEIINISTNNQTTINELFTIMKDTANIGIDVQYAPARDGDIVHSYLDNTKAEKLLGWKVQYNLKDGLKETIKYYIDLNVFSL